MSQPMSLSDIRNEVLANGFAPNVYTVDRLNRWINDGLGDVTRRVGYYTDQATQTITTVSGTSTYDWSNAPVVGKIQDVYDADAGRTLTQVELRVMDNSDPAATGRPGWYALVGQALKLYPTPDNTYDLVMRYWRTAPTLTSDGQNPTLPPDYHHLLVEYATARAWRSEDDFQLANVWKAEYEDGVKKFATDVKLPGEGPLQARSMWDSDPALTSTVDVWS